MVGTKHQVSFSQHLVIGCQVCQPIKEEKIKTLLFLIGLQTQQSITIHEVFVFRKRDLMFRKKYGNCKVLFERCQNIAIRLWKMEDPINERKFSITNYLLCSNLRETN